MSRLHNLLAQIDRQGDSSCLDLVGAEITDAIMPYLLDHIRKKHYAFQIIKLVKNNISDEGLRSLLSYLSSDRTTQVLNLTSNHLTQHSLDWIICFAEVNEILRTFYLSNNKISSFHLKTKKKESTALGLELII